MFDFMRPKGLTSDRGDCEWRSKHEPGRVFQISPVQTSFNSVQWKLSQEEPD